MSDPAVSLGLQLGLELHVGIVAHGVHQPPSLFLARTPRRHPPAAGRSPLGVNSRDTESCERPTPAPAMILTVTTRLAEPLGSFWLPVLTSTEDGFRSGPSCLDLAAVSPHTGLAMVGTRGGILDEPRDRPSPPQGVSGLPDAVRSANDEGC